MKNFKDLLPRVPREERPVEFVDEIAYDAEHTINTLQVGLRFFNAKTKRVEVKSAQVGSAIELVFDTPLPGGFNAKGTITATPDDGRTRLSVVGTSDVPFANAIVNSALKKAIDVGNARIKAAAERKAAAAERNDGPQGPEGPHSGL